MGGFLGIGHSSAKTDRGIQLGGFKDIENVFNYALPTAKAGISAGTDLLGKAGDYWKNLLSGNRTALLQATAPETNTALARQDASRRQLATSGTARGGGVASTNQTAKDRTMAEIDNILFGVRPEAAKGAESVGTREAAIGTDILGIGSRAASDVTALSGESRKTSYTINQDTVGKVSQAVLNVLAALPV